MPNFDFKLIVKQKTKRTDFKTINKNKIVEKDIRGVICIASNAKYYVSVKGKHYLLTKESFECKGKVKIYRQGCDELKRLCYIRANDNLPECDHNIWLPFSPGCIVIGNIVFNNIIKLNMFHIKKVKVDYWDEEAEQAFRFYKEHFDEINQIRLNKKYGVSNCAESGR